MKPFKPISKLLTILTITSLMGCAHKQAYRNLSSWNEKTDQSVQLSVRTIKLKKNKVDLNVVVKNGYPFSVIIPENSMHFEINGDQGVSSGNPHWLLRAGDIVAYTMKYELAMHEDGAPVLKLEHIQTNSSNGKNRPLPPVILMIPLDGAGNPAPTGPANNGGYSLLNSHQ